MGYEILYDISCMNNLSYALGSQKYINEFGRDTGLKYETGLVQEYLYPHIKKQGYEVLLFVYVCDKNDEKRKDCWLGLHIQNIGEIPIDHMNEKNLIDMKK